MKNEEKLTFGKKLKYSIFDFDKYQELATEKIGRTIVYIVLLMVIFNIFTAGIYTYKIFEGVEKVKLYISENIETITFDGNILDIIPKNKENELKVQENENMAIDIIINTKVTEKAEIEQYVKEISNEESAILILNDRIMIKNSANTKPYEYLYSNIANQYDISSISKQDIIDLLSGDAINTILGTSFIICFIYLFVIFLSNILVDILMFSAMGYLVTLIARIRVKYSTIYNIAAYATTLPILLNIIYFLLNSLTGFEIQYFRVMYIAVTSIYIIAAILMIKTDVIKKQLELSKIIEEQDRVREELKRKEEQEKDEIEKERQRKEEQEKLKQKEQEKDDDKEEKKKRKTSKKPDVNIGKEPEGNNV